MPSIVVSTDAVRENTVLADALAEGPAQAEGNLDLAPRPLDQ
jgi:hypothetical protein